MVPWGMRFVLSFVLVAFGCGDDDATLPDAGADGGSDATVDVGVDAPVDAGTDAGADAGADAGPDAGSDVGPVDANPDVFDAGPVGEPTLFAAVSGELVTLDPSTGDATTIGAFGLAIEKLAWDPVTETLYAIYDTPGAPKLATVDVCTGEATATVTLTLPGNFVDGFDFDASGQAYVAVSADGSFPADGAAETLATLDTTTGMVTAVAGFTGGVDGDEIILGTTPPIAIDGDSGGNEHFFYDLDVSTAALTNVRSDTPRAARQVLHEGVVYGIGAAGGIAGQLVSQDIATSGTTAIGGSFALATFRSAASGIGCPPE